MRTTDSGAWPRSGCRPRSAASEMRAIKIVWQRELIRYSSDRLRIATSLLQPVLFLFVLGTGLSRLAMAGTGGLNLRTFMYPGILGMTVLFTAIFSAASVVWDREFGFLREMLVAPVRRSSIVIGKCLGGATVATAQGVLMIAMAGPGRRSLRAGADARRVRPADPAVVHVHGIRPGRRRAGQADAVVHGADPDAGHAAVLPVRRDVPGHRPADLADRAQPGRPAHLRRRPDASRRLRPPDA